MLQQHIEVEAAASNKQVRDNFITCLRLTRQENAIIHRCSSQQWSCMPPPPSSRYMYYSDLPVLRRLGGYRIGREAR